MPKYVFLDTWALSEYSKPKRAAELVLAAQSQDLHFAVNALSMVESFNPGWAGASGNERGLRIAELLASVPTVIVDPRQIMRRELLSFPAQLEELPLMLELAEIKPHLRAETILRFLRSDPLFLVQSKNIQKWAADYQAMKDSWPSSVTAILERAVQDGLLRKSGRKYCYAGGESREELLRSLDLRHFSSLTHDELELLRPHILDLVLKGKTRCLSAIRTCSLLFVAAYVDDHASQGQAIRGSDLGDHWHFSVASYFSLVTADGEMKKLLERISSEAGLSCRVLNQAEFSAMLAQ